MHLALCLLCIFISCTIARENKCLDDEWTVKTNDYMENDMKNGTKNHMEGKKCAISLTINQKSYFTQPFYNDRSVRFNQMQRLHLIGGSVVCDDEIEHALLRLLYLYSCIFPAINKMRNGTAQDWIVFQDVSNLDQQMQEEGRVILHQHKRGEGEQLRMHLVDFIRQLNETNYHGHEGSFKLYRSFCSNVTSRLQHTDAPGLLKQDDIADELENFE